MDIIQKKLIKTSAGWHVEFLVILNEKEFSKINLVDVNELLTHFKGYNVQSHGNNFSVCTDFVKMEPWEDETPEEMAKSILKEIESLFKRLIN